jgi:hypothetical protein
VKKNKERSLPPDKSLIFWRSTVGWQAGQGRVAGPSTVSRVGWGGNAGIRGGGVLSEMNR